MLALLLGLGTWQVQRRTWKRGILDAIDHAEAAPAIPLPEAPAQFTKVRAEGTFLAAPPLIYGAEVRAAQGGERMGGQLLVPMRLTDGRLVLVDRGWVPADAPPPSPSGTVTVDGYIRVPEHAGMLSAPDDVAGHRIYTLDPAVAAASLGITGLAPYTLVALGPLTTVPPEPAQRLPRPPNDHLSYALTWYGLAVVLVVIFALSARKARTA
jgi:surfeit locus 1 family protein